MIHELPPLPYAYEALEPYIATRTMQLHHEVHHLAYIQDLNYSDASLREARNAGNFSLAKYWARESAFYATEHALHCSYWENMTPHGGGEPTGTLRDALITTFGGFAAFYNFFKGAGSTVKGAGWVLLVKNNLTKTLNIVTVERHEDFLKGSATPLLVCDLWEHAYYLQFQNERERYLDAFKECINWNDVSRRFAEG